MSRSVNGLSTASDFTCSDRLCEPSAKATVKRSLPPGSTLPLSNSRNGAHMPGTASTPPGEAGSTLSLAPPSPPAGHTSVVERTGPWA